MSISQSSMLHRKAGLAACAIPTRAARNSNPQPSILIGDRVRGRPPESFQPLREGGREASIAARYFRCEEKGCVFPAEQDGTGICRQHRRERREPTLFHSLQVTGLLLDAAKLGLANSKRDLQRQQDRRRLEAVRERFLEEIT